MKHLSSSWRFFMILLFANLVKTINSQQAKVDPVANIDTVKRVDKPAMSNLKAQQKIEKVKTYAKGPPTLIAGSAECGDDVVRICGARKHSPSSNFDILSCLVNNQDNDGISNTCNRYLWQFKVNVTSNLKYGRIAQGLCGKALAQAPECVFDKTDGRMISCLIEKRDTLPVTEPACLSFLTKFQSIIFSDFHLICDFIEECKPDITKYKCESLERGPEEGEFSHSQGEVVACLEKQLVKDSSALQPLCFKQIIRIAELSADDYHLDRALYFKCRNDRENLCADVKAGQGKVYQCLFNHKFDSQMSSVCRQALTDRQKVQAIDYKANSALLHECRREIVKRECNKSATDDHLVHLSSVMLCLETSKHPTPLSDRCETELIEFRRMLMENYEMSPEITLHCSAAINQHCQSGTEQGQGRTIHCLLELARNKENKVQTLDKQCENALSELLEETGALEDYRMDAVLTASCRAVISHKCSKDQSDDSMVLGCLMDHLHDKTMTRKCKSALLDLQYFVSRDFRLDPSFRSACGEEAKELCDPHTQMEGNSVGFNFVLACLYARVHPDPKKKPLSPECADEVHRVIRQRALDVQLNPELEEQCRSDLSEHCSDGAHEDNTEFACLQERFDSLSENCKNEVKKLTQMESENFLDFDDILAKECEPMLQQFCRNEAEKGDEGAVVECLISNKERMSSEKCAAGVTHFQLIEMKNYNFNYKFTKACKEDVKKNCPGLTNKGEVVECLSKLVRNRILAAERADDVAEVSQKCREQMTVEKLQMHTNIEFNPNLHKSCHDEAKRLCAEVKPGSAMVIECLRKHKKKITDKECYKSLFTFEKEEVENPNLDYRLMRRCKSDIQKHCSEYMQIGDAQKIVECLLEHKKVLMDICKDVVREREKDMFDDIELNLDLQNSCKKDIRKFCKDEIEKSEKAHDEGKDPEGVVYSCLIDIFTDETGDKVLSDNCFAHVEFVIKEEQRDYELNPNLMLACVDFIQTQCSPKIENNVIKCLEEKFLDNSISDANCMIEVAKLLREGRSDIEADPLLHEACALDVNSLCPKIPQGHGKVIQCLINSQSSLSKECAQVLTERQAMWNQVRKRLGGIGDLGSSILESEHSAYLLSMLTFLLMLVLCTGAFCGRITKRVSVDRKMQ